MSEPDPLRKALRALPRERASPDFTSRVLAGAGTRPAARVGARRRRWVTAAVALLLATTLWQLEAARRERALERRAGRLLAERRQVESELARLRGLAQTEPTLRLAAGEDFEVVVGLAPWLAAQRRIEP